MYVGLEVCQLVMLFAPPLCHELSQITDEPLLSTKTNDNQNSITMSVETFCPIGERDVLQLKVQQLSKYPRVLKDASYTSTESWGSVSITVTLQMMHYTEVTSK
jgi:hypothetical protein